MTIPITPGPFSFLAEAGDALGEFGKARTRAREEARKGVETLQNLIQLGILPAQTLESKETQHLFQVAGIPPVQQGGTVPQPKNKRAAIELGELNTVQPGTAQARTVAGVPSEPVAAGTETATVAKTGAEVSQAGEQTAQSTLRQNVLEGATRMLTEVDPKTGKPAHPEMVQLAQEVALGLLPLRIARLAYERQNLSLERQAMADNLKILLGSISEISDQYQRKDQEWTRAAMQQMALNPRIDSNDPRQVAAFLQSFEQIVKRPTYESVRDDYLRTNLGMDAADFQHRVQSGMNEFFGPKGATPAPGGQHQGAPAPYARPGGHKNKVDMAVAAIAARIRANPAGGAELIHMLRDAYQQHAYTSTEVRSILARSGMLDQPLAKDFLREIGEQ